MFSDNGEYVTTQSVETNVLEYAREEEQEAQDEVEPDMEIPRKSSAPGTLEPDGKGRDEDAPVNGGCQFVQDELATGVQAYKAT